MGRCYGHFSLEERCTLSRLSQAGKTIRQIAAIMDRSPSTITRELKRNSGAKLGYQPAYAQQQAKSRHWRGSRLLRDVGLQQEVLKRLGQGWSPDQVAGRLKKQKRRKVISYESIYRFIDSQIRRTKDYSWRHYLPRGKSKRGWRGRKGGSPVDHIQGRVSIARRPAYINKRRQAGHWKDARACSWSHVSPIKQLTLWLPNSQIYFAPCQRRCVERSPSITGQSLRTINVSINSPCVLSFAILMPPGKRAVSKTALDACAEDCPGKLTWPHCPIHACSACFVLIITLPESALTIKLRQRFLFVTCCT